MGGSRLEIERETGKRKRRPAALGMTGLGCGAISEPLRLRSGQVPLRPPKGLLLEIEGGLGEVGGAA
jgi:hypothetical protein